MKTINDYMDPRELQLYRALVSSVEAIEAGKEGLRGKLAALPTKVRRDLNRSKRAVAEARLSLWRLARARAEQDGVGWLPLDIEQPKGPEVKYCPKCQLSLPLERFLCSRSKTNSKSSYCRICLSDYNAARYRARKQRQALLQG